MATYARAATAAGSVEERAGSCVMWCASLCGLAPDEQSLIGVVSLFPAMLRILMEDLIRLLPLRETARGALMGREIPEGKLLHWMICQKHGNWAECDAIVCSSGMNHEQVLRCHCQQWNGPRRRCGRMRERRISGGDGFQISREKPGAPGFCRSEGGRRNLAVLKCPIGVGAV